MNASVHRLLAATDDPRHRRPTRLVADPGAIRTRDTGLGGRRKTDVADSAWIAQMFEHGLVRPSFLPPLPIRELPDLTRHRRTLVEERTRVVQRLEKVMQDAGIKLTGVPSALLTKSGRAILEALPTG